MPELPDVQVFKEYMDATSLHKTIESIDVHDDYVLEDGVSELKDGLIGRSFESTRRHGKHLFAELDNGQWLMLHFGMSGHLRYFKHMEDEPSHSRFLINFANSYHLAYDSQRMLGEIELVDDVDRYVEERDLGPDVMDDDFDLAAFKSVLEGHRGMVKPTLMNQGIMAGLGNVYVDEILYQAGIHPETKVNELSDEEIDSLYRTMHDVLQTAIERRARPSDFPDSWIIPQRHAKGMCPCCDEPVTKIEVSGRGTYICPQRQSKPDSD